MKWVNTDRGWINLDHVRRIVTRRKEQPGRHATELLDGEDRCIATTWRSLEYLDVDIIASVPGQTVWLVTVYGEHEIEVAAELRDVIAWRVDDMVALPVLAGDQAASNQVVLLCHQDGSVSDPGNALYSSLATAITEIRKEHIQAMERDAARNKGKESKVA